MENNTAEFTHATDDLEFLRLVLGEPIVVDDYTRQVAEKLGLERSLPYWIGLLRHENAHVRTKAAQQVERLTGVAVSMPEAAEPAASRLRASGPLFDAEREYARVMAWYEQNQPSLIWDNAVRAYRLGKALDAPDSPRTRPDDDGERTHR